MVGRLVVSNFSSFWPFKFKFLNFLSFERYMEWKGNGLKSDLSTLKSSY